MNKTIRVVICIFYRDHLHFMNTLTLTLTLTHTQSSDTHRMDTCACVCMCVRQEKMKNGRTCACVYRKHKKVNEYNEKTHWR